MSANTRADRYDEESSDISDESLVEAVRAGDSSAYAVLWERHADAARRAARAITSAFDPDDLVSEAFASVLSAIHNGAGPTEAFRPYLFATVRNLAAMWGKKGRPLALDLLPDDVLADADGDPFATMSERSTITQVFTSLPPRHRTLLWYLEVEGMKPREIAPLMGLTPNAVSALSYRAREGFRQAWLHAHIADPARPEECRWFCERVVVQGKRVLARVDVPRFNVHLRTCRGCQIVAADIENVSRRLRVIVLPLLLGGAAATAYLADSVNDAASAAPWFAPDPVGGAEIPVVTHAAGEGAVILRGTTPAVVETKRHVGAGLALTATLTTAAVVVASAVLLTATGVFSETPVTAAPAPSGLVEGEIVAEVSPQRPTPAPTSGPPPAEGARPRPVQPVDDAEASPEADAALPSAPAASEQPSSQNSTPAPSPTPAPSSAPDAGFRFTNSITPEAMVPEILTGIGVPGAAVTLSDESGLPLVATTVAADGTFHADVSGAALRQGMSIRAVHAVADSVTLTRTLGPLTFAVPALTTADTDAALESVSDDDPPYEGEQCPREVRMRVTGAAGAWVAVTVGDSDARLVQLVDGVYEEILTVEYRARHLITLQYVDPQTGRGGLAVEHRIAASSRERSGPEEPQAPPDADDGATAHG